ncbi:glycosyltransferase [Arenibacterium sp. CAU 1754]
MTDKLTIALVSAFPPGQQSLNEYGYHLARALIARDDVAKVVIIADMLDEPAAELDLGPKLEVRRTWRFNGLGSMPEILRTLSKADADGAIFNVQTASFGDREVTAALGLMTPMVARWLGTPSGIIAHNIIAGVDLEKTILKGQRLRQALVKLGGVVVSRAMTAANYVTVTLPSYETLLKSQFPKADITLVPHGTFDTDDHQTEPLHDRPKRIVTMGKFGTYKRLETLLAAFDILRRDPEFNDFQLCIGGTDHPNTPGYMADAAQSRAQDDAVTFQGYIPEDGVAEFFADARLSVFDYDSTTGSSGVLHQTVSYGTVPIFPRIGDFVDVCEAEGLRGYHYAPGDAEGMADAMQSALSDLPAAESLAKANRAAAMGIPMADIVGFHIGKFVEKGHGAAGSAEWSTTPATR